MIIKPFEPKYKNQVIALILYLQNFDNKVDLSLQEQPDMDNIPQYYQNNGGQFWIAVNDDDNVIGTIGLMNEGNHYGVLKKFFVNFPYRGQKIGTATKLYNTFLQYARDHQINHIILDTPAACSRAHHFYERNGFHQIDRQAVPISYDYPDRDSLFFQLDL